MSEFEEALIEELRKLRREVRSVDSTICMAVAFILVAIALHGCK